jgi:hypothetical protein
MLRIQVEVLNGMIMNLILITQLNLYKILHSYMEVV